MSKGLEALERIQCNYAYVFKARENGKTQLVHDLNTIKKELKALEIIKNIGILKPYETSGGQCWLETMCDATKITKDNYDLLKEELL